MDQKNKIIIFDWGGVVESHFPDETNYQTAQIAVINHFNEQTKKIDEETVKNKQKECDYDENGKCISEVNSYEDIQKWFERVRLKFNLKCNYDEFYQVYQKENVVKWESLKTKKIKILNGIYKGAICKVIDVEACGVTLKSECFERGTSTGDTKTIPHSAINTYQYIIYA